MLKNKRVFIPLIIGIAIASSLGAIAIVDAATPALLVVNRTYPGGTEDIPIVSVNAQTLLEIPKVGDALAKVDEIHSSGFAFPGPHQEQITSLQAQVLIESLPFKELTRDGEEYSSYYVVIEYNDKMYLVGIKK